MKHLLAMSKDTILMGMSINHYRVLRTERSSLNRKTTLNKSYFNPLAPTD
ncbi:TPA: hypothetical protein V0I19_002050 [Streptococcus pneumoniae]|nr:hypothetical protein [Streptococcus pneumoniae]